MLLRVYSLNEQGQSSFQPFFQNDAFVDGKRINLFTDEFHEQLLAERIREKNEGYIFKIFTLFDDNSTPEDIQAFEKFLDRDAGYDIWCIKFETCDIPAAVLRAVIRYINIPSHKMTTLSLVSSRIRAPDDPREAEVFLNELAQAAVHLEEYTSWEKGDCEVTKAFPPVLGRHLSANWDMTIMERLTLRQISNGAGPLAEFIRCCQTLTNLFFCEIQFEEEDFTELLQALVNRGRNPDIQRNLEEARLSVQNIDPDVIDYHARVGLLLDMIQYSKIEDIALPMKGHDIFANPSFVARLGEALSESFYVRRLTFIGHGWPVERLILLNRHIRHPARLIEISTTNVDNSSAAERKALNTRLMLMQMSDRRSIATLVWAMINSKTSLFRVLPEALVRTIRRYLY